MIFLEGVRVIDVVPKRFVRTSLPTYSNHNNYLGYSAAGKILRRELRELAKREEARGEIDTASVKSRL